MMHDQESVLRGVAILLHWHAAVYHSETVKTLESAEICRGRHYIHGRFRYFVRVLGGDSLDPGAGSEYVCCLVVM